MSWDFYSLQRGRNNGLFYRIEGKLKRGYMSKEGYRFDVDCLRIFRGKSLPPVVILIKPKNRYDYDSKRLQNIANQFIGKDSVDMIFWRGGFRRTGRLTFKKKGRHFIPAPEYTGIAEKIWERPSS